MDLYELDKQFEKFLKKFPDGKRKLVEEAGEKLYRQVIMNIEASTGNKEVISRTKATKTNKEKPTKKKISKVSNKRQRALTGNLKKAVTKVVGSGGGYSAIRADHKIAPHTHLIENGHKVVKNGIQTGWAPGKHMYRNALNTLASELENESDKFIDTLVGEIFD